MLDMRFREGKKVSEIAAKMQMELSATKVALARAVEKLKQLCVTETELVVSE